jgi:hypothetical protein
MNSPWVGYQVLKRGDDTDFDSARGAIVFKLKLASFMKFVQEEQNPDKVSVFVWRIEYQERGLQHAQISFCADCETDDICIPH